MLAYHVEWHLRQAWEPLLLMEALVRPTGKKATGRTKDGLVACRYRDLLRELAGETRNTMRFLNPPKATLTLHPTPSPLRQRAFDLLGLIPAL